MHNYPDIGASIASGLRNLTTVTEIGGITYPPVSLLHNPHFTRWPSERRLGGQQCRAVIGAYVAELELSEPRI